MIAVVQEWLELGRYKCYKRADDRGINDSSLFQHEEETYRA